VVQPARIGVFGGTFDPPHVGHLVAAINVRHALALDVVLFVVASVPWQKVGTRPISGPEDRLRMTELAVDGRSCFAASPVEIDRGGDSVTADTLELLTDVYRGAEFIVIVGSDAASGMASWRRIEDLGEMATVAVVDRAGAAGGRPPTSIPHQVVPCPLMDLSSSEIRRRAAAGLPLDYLVPDGVRDHIEEGELYS
jgi:nicotinate-nucleotide adenylyltransferase